MLHDNLSRIIDACEKKQGRGRYKNIIVSLRATAGFTNVAEFYRLSPVCGHDFVHVCSKRWVHGFF